MEPPHEEVSARALASLVDYQSGGVVSRTLLKRGRGSVTLFAFDAGQSLSEHTVPHDALVHVLDGTAQITIDGTEHRLGSGDSIVMPGGHPHAVLAISQFRMVLTMLRD